MNITVYAATENSFEKALNSFQQQDYASSIIHLKNSLQNNSKHLSSRVLLAENYLALRQAKNAETELETAKKNGASNAKISPLLAQAYLQQKQYDKVLEILTPRSSDLNFKSQILAYRGLAYLGKKELILAQQSLDEALALVPINIDAILGLAKLALAEENNVKALTFIEKAKGITSNNKHALLMAAVTYKLINDQKNSLSNVNQLLSLEPDNYSALLIRATLYSELAMHKEALADIDKIVIAIPNEPISNYVKMLSLTATNENDYAEQTRLHLATIIDGISQEIMAEQPIYYFLSGLVSFKSGAFERAEKEFLKYYKINPEDFNVIKLLARTQMALGEYFQAKKHLIKAHLLDQNETEIISLLGRVSMLLGELDKAEYYFNLALKAQPQSLTAQTDLARLLLFTGKFHKLIQLFSLAEKSNQYAESIGTELLFMLAKAYLETKNYPSALTITEKIITLEPNNSYAYQLKGSLAGLMGNYAQAEQNYLTSISLDKSNFQVVMLLARFEAAQGKYQQAITRIQNQLAYGDNSALFNELGDIYTQTKDHSNATIYYRKALAHNPSSVLSLTKIVDKLVANNEIAAAITSVEEYLRKYDGNPDIHQLAATLYYKNNQHTNALYELEQAVKLSNQKGNSLLKLAQMQLQLTQRDNAINSLQRAIAWEEEYTPAYLKLIAIYSEDKNEAKALELINKLTAMNANTSLINRLKGELYWALNNTSKAESFFNLSLRQEATKPAILGLYRIYRRAEHYQKIQSLLSNWLAENPNDLTSAISLAENYHQQGDLLAAKNYYQMLLAKNPNNLILLNNMAVIEQKLQNYDNAAALAEQAYSLNNKSVNIIDTKAWIEVQRGNYQTALSLLREANTLDYQNAEVKYHLAVTLDKIGQRNQGLAYLEAAVKSQQNFTDKPKAIALLKIWQNLENPISEVNN